MGRTRPIGAAALVLLLAVAVSGCAASWGNGLTNSRATSTPETATRARDPVVLGRRAALSDAREQQASAAPPVQAVDAGGRGDAPPTPPRKPLHESVDTGAARALAKAREDAAKAQPRPAQAPAPSGANVVEVAPGDTLLKIANRHRVSVAALMAANRLASLDVQPGQRLIIPKR